MRKQSWVHMITVRIKRLKHSAIILYVAWREDLDQEPKKLSRGFLRQTRGTYVLMGQNLTYERRRFRCGINSIAKSARRAAMHPFRAAVRLSTRFLSKRNILTSDETASFHLISFSLLTEKHSRWHQRQPIPPQDCRPQALLASSTSFCAPYIDRSVCSVV